MTDRRRRALAVAALTVAAAGSIATSQASNWHLEASRELGPVSFPTGAPPLVHHLTATASAAAFTDSVGTTASFVATLCPATDAGGFADVRRRSLIVVFTDFADPTSAELMIENIGRLASKHLVLFVAIRDQELDDLTTAEPKRRSTAHARSSRMR